MALLGFQKWKADKVESGECRQTIRARRVHPVKVGDRLIFARGVRTKNYRKIGEAVCTETFSLIALEIGKEKRWVWMDITRAQFEEIAVRDGFNTCAEMNDWFEKNHTMKNGFAQFDVIRW